MAEQGTHLPYHRRYRPRTISQYIGNARIKKGVMAALKTDNKPQVILMTGHAGTGKTSMARLLVKEYLCENRDDIGGACGQCDNCVRVEEYIETGNPGNLMYLNEIDVTDSNKKEDISNMLDDAALPTYDGSWKIFILDECHAMTTAAQNRLLKNLEEPAEKVLMVLCTTDPEKLLETIISRCQYQFEVQKPTREELSGLLAHICDNEGAPYDARGLSVVCAKSGFAQRKALVALEQVIQEKQSALYNDVVEVLQMIGDKYYFDFYKLLLREVIDVYSYVTYVGDIKSRLNFKPFLEGLIDFSMRGIYIANGVTVEAMDKVEIKQYKELFSRFSVGDIAYLLQLLIKIKDSKDIEARLLLLGYTGIKRQSQAAVIEKSESDAELVDVSAFNPTQERTHGNNNYLKEITMSDDEKEEFVSSHKKEVSPTSLAEMFQGKLINLGDTNGSN